MKRLKVARCARAYALAEICRRLKPTARLITTAYRRSSASAYSRKSGANRGPASPWANHVPALRAAVLAGENAWRDQLLSKDGNKTGNALAHLDFCDLVAGVGDACSRRLRCFWAEVDRRVADNLLEKSKGNAGGEQSFVLVLLHGEAVEGFLDVRVGATAVERDVEGLEQREKSVRRAR